MQAMKLAGYKIPRDIAFVGFNNDPVSNIIGPNLSSLDYQGYKLGEVAAQNLINHLNGTITLDITNGIILRPDLIIRASSKKIH